MNLQIDQLFSQFPNKSYVDWLQDIKKEILKKSGHSQQSSHLESEQIEDWCSFDLNDEIRLKALYTDTDLKHLESTNGPCPPTNHDFGKTANLIEVNEKLEMLGGSGHLKHDQSQICHLVHLPDDFNSTSKFDINESDFDKIFSNKEIKYRLFFAGKGAELTRAILNLFEKGSAEFRQNNSQFIKNSISFGLDPIASVFLSGKQNFTKILPLQVKELSELIEHKNKLKVTSSAITIQNHCFEQAGANEQEQLALAIGSAVYILRELEKLGHDVDEIASQISFELAAGTDFFTTLSKVRALRKMWANVLTQIGIKVRNVSIHLRSSLVAQSKIDPCINILRGTSAAAAGIWSGCESICIFPYDYLLGVPKDHSIRLAQNTLTLLKEESHLNKVFDPAFGSFALENMTDELAQRAWSLFQEIEKTGDLGSYLERKDYLRKLEKNKNDIKLALRVRKRKLTGVNEYPLLEDKISFYDNRPFAFQTMSSQSSYRQSEEFEDLREKAHQFKEQKKRRATYALLKFGEPKNLRGRIEFLHNSLGVGGLQLEKEIDLEDTSWTDLLKELATPLFALVCQDDDYPSQLEKIKKQLKGKNKIIIVHPEQSQWNDFRSVECLNLKSDLVDLLKNVWTFLDSEV